MKLNFNWGIGIFIVIIVMVSWIGFLISKAFEYKINIDSDDYYGRGLDHRAQMERISRCIAYKNEFAVELSKDFVLINYPSFFKDKIVSGELWFYRLSDFELDKKIAVSIREDNIQKINLQHFRKGRYLLRATKDADGLSYFFENEILIK